jgi:hypothetical protein
MRSWLAVHYPHPFPDDVPWYVYLRDEHDDVARMVKSGDVVLFYELRKRHPLADGTTFPSGRDGIVAAATVCGGPAIRDASASTVRYADGTVEDWRFELPTRDVDFSGFIPRGDVFRIMGQPVGYTMRWFGSRGSGVKQLTESQSAELLRIFARRQAMPIRAQFELRPVTGPDDIVANICAFSVAAAGTVAS